MKTNISRKSGFTLVEIMIVVAIIGLLAAIAIPNFVKARENARKNTCIANLKQIQGAVQQWALETKQAADASWAMTDVHPAYITGAAAPTCPTSGTEYAGGTVNADPVCPTDPTNHTL
jgi:prepilin-type N-terminal cleavage/methylation domain-containing protein